MSQLEERFIGDNQVSGQKFRLKNNEYARARNAANNADVNLFRLTSADEFELGKQPVADASLPVPSADKHYVTVEYINNLVLGKTDAKDAVSLAADSDQALSGSTPLTIDGITAVDGDRILLFGQTDGTANGIYDFNDAGATYTLTRSTDFDEDSEVTKGSYTVAVDGTTYSGYLFILTTDDPITVGTTSLTFSGQPSALKITAGDMLAKVGNTLSVDLASNGGLESSNPGNDAGQLRVKVDTAAAEKDKSTRLDATGFVDARANKKETFTLASQDITNGYLDLAAVAGQDSVRLAVAGAGEQVETVDYTVNYTGGASSKTRVTFAGGLASGGVSALAAGDVVTIYYDAF